jgi:hypothetical protein
MKRLFVFIISVVLSANFLTAYAGEQETTPFMTRNFPASSVREVEATTTGGSLTLTGDTGSEAIVEVYVSRDNWTAERIRQTLEENYTIDIKVEGGKLLVEAKQKNRITNWNQQGLNISFNIIVPRQADSKMQTSGGALIIKNVSGNTDGATSGGGINITGSSDNIYLRTSGGSVVARDCTGNINLRTSGGGISMNNLNGNIEARTSGGSIIGKGISGVLVTATSGGSVNLDGISGNLEATASGGNMSVKIKSVNNYVKLANTGNINLTLPSGSGYNLNVQAGNLSTSGLRNFQGNTDNRSIRGTVGNGGPEINVRTSLRTNVTFE